MMSMKNVILKAVLTAVLTAKAPSVIGLRQVR
jgi:hypothetical protein